MKITVSTPIIQTPRVLQVRGLFDLPESKSSAMEWEVAMPLQDRPWHIGLIVGPSGCGKSSIARHLWPGAYSGAQALSWSKDHTCLDDFPETLPVKDLVGLVCAVGFSSPPDWLRPFHVLSTGQQ